MGVGAIIGAITAITSLASGVKANQEAKRNRKAQSQAQKQMVEQAEREAQAQEEEWNRQNSKTPDLDALYKENASDGDYSSMLTGTQGIDYGQLTLGKNSLLGSGSAGLGSSGNLGGR